MVKCGQTCEVYSRNEKGQFIPTTKSTRYKMVQLKGKHMGEHKKIWILTHGKEEFKERVEFKNES